MSDIISLVDAATTPKTFSVLDAAKNRSYPQDIVTVYTDAESAYQVNVLERKINDTKDNEELEALAAEQDAFKALVKASGITFRLRGIDPGLVKRIGKEADAKFPDDIGDRNEFNNYSLIAAHIVDVTDADGAVDASRWDAESITGLRDLLPGEEFDKITNLMIELSFAAQLFDASVTPDFSLA